MSVEKELGKSVVTQSDRDAAVDILRRRYGDAVRRSDSSWGDLFHLLGAKAVEQAGPPDWIELSEVEGRGVMTVWPKIGTGRCWVWTRGAWRDVPGLLAKASLEGRRLSRYHFAVEFPGADLAEAERLALASLGPDPDPADVSSPAPDPRFVRDGELMHRGYALTFSTIRDGRVGALEVMKDVLRELRVPLHFVEPYICNWYNFACVEMGEPRGFDSPYQTSKLFAALQCGYAFGNTGPDDEEYGFLSSGQNALERYGEQEFHALAKKVRYDLRRCTASGIFGDHRRHRHLWDEYCLQVQCGPEELESSWEQTVEPSMRVRVDALPSPIAVLLTIAAQSKRGEFEGQDGSLRDDALIITEVWDALVVLANEKSQWWDEG